MFFKSFGFSIKMGGLDDNLVRGGGYGSVRKDKKREVTVCELLEPLVDIFEEADHTLIIADMPGVCGKDICINLKDDILQISADTIEKKYHKEILLKKSYTKDVMAYNYKNGVLEIKFNEE